jgi:hypothetical protein
MRWAIMTPGTEVAKNESILGHRVQQGEFRIVLNGSGEVSYSGHTAHVLAGKSQRDNR